MNIFRHVLNSRKTMISNPKIEMMPFEKKKTLILQRFLKTLCWAYEKSPFYQKKYTQAKIFPNDIKSINDISKLPLTTIDELKNINPLDLLTVPLSVTLRLNKTISGLYRGSTADDIARNMDITVRALASNNINKASTILLCGKYSSQYLLDLHYAAEALGATVIPCNDAQAAVELYDIFNANTLITSSQNLLEFLDKSPKALPPKIIALTNTFQKDVLLDNIETRMNRTLPKIYMSRYFGLAGMFFTCEEKRLHIQDDYLYTEIVDGSLVVTPLTFEAMPIIRLQTQISAQLNRSVCDCGRTLAIIELNF